jgi:hypothetical protein
MGRSTFSLAAHVPASPARRGRRTSILAWPIPRACLALAGVAVIAAPGRAQLPTLHSFHGDEPGRRLGVAVAGAGDVDADGFGDLIVGATDGTGNSSQIGEAHAYSGRDGSLIHTFQAKQPGTAFGAAVAGAGGVDQDGFADVVIGAHYDDTSAIFAGAVYVYSGRTGSLLHAFYGDSEGDRMGGSVGGAGDVDADGYPDLIAGAYFDSNTGFWAGSARLFSGKDGHVLRTLDGAAAWDRFGWSVDGAGDADGDGSADVIVGAIDEDNGFDSGSARIFSGATGEVLHTFAGAAAGDGFGVSVRGAGDVDGDGRGDVIVGAWQNDQAAPGAGSAAVFSGRDGSVLHTFYGSAQNQHFGYSTSGAGEFDGDGVPDLVVGAYFDGHNGAAAGSASLYSGADGSLLMTLYGDAPGDFFGYSVSEAGDVDGDGLTDVIVGAPYDDDFGTSSGSAHVFAGFEPVATYCTAKPGLVCGTPAIGYSGIASASAGAGFVVSAAPARGHVPGLLLYSAAGPSNTPFQGGTLCAAPPILRGPLVDSGGTAGQCDGVFALDLNAFAAGLVGGNPAGFLSAPGTSVVCQWWGRDSASTLSFLSDALQYVVRP